MRVVTLLLISFASTKRLFIRSSISVFIVGLIGCSQHNKDFGSLLGNIYWKYNNFVGNRPDAGSRIDIYSLTDSTIRLHTIADVRGDYRFDSIPVGEYIAIVQSKSTTKSAKDNLGELYMSSPYLERVFNVKYDSLFKSNFYRKIEFFDSLSDAALNGDPTSKSLDQLNASLKWTNAYKDSSINVADSIINMMPATIKISTGVFSNGSNSVDIKQFTIEKNRTTNLVTDFGTTYF